MELSIALNRYDRHLPFFNQTIAPPEGLELKACEVGEILRLMVMRRELKINYPELPRQIRKLFWDVCEVAQSFYGASNYFLMICARNALEQ